MDPYLAFGLGASCGLLVAWAVCAWYLKKINDALPTNEQMAELRKLVERLR